MEQFKRLFDIIKTLRGENGCPWDKEQTTGTMAADLIEETYEVVESIESGRDIDLEEELGDLFFLALFISYIGEQEKRFTVEKVIQGVADKLVRRHPHVFGNTEVKNVDEIFENWEAIKLSEVKNQDRKTPFDGIPDSLPEIQRFNKIMDKAKRSNYNLPEASESVIKSFRDSLTGQAKTEGFIKDLLIYCWQNKIGLPALIRKISNKTIHDFNEKNPG